jgi:hypothetical protein
MEGTFVCLHKGAAFLQFKRKTDHQTTPSQYMIPFPDMKNPTDDHQDEQRQEQQQLLLLLLL